MNIGDSPKYYYNLATQRSTFLRAIRVSLLVGIILNLINNPGIFSSLGFEEIQFSRVILTFIVPFCVSTYSSVLSNTSMKSGKISQKDGIIKCNIFKQTRFTINIGPQNDHLPIEKFWEIDYLELNEYQLPVELMMENAGLNLARLEAHIM